jgi:hypothetical protein
MIIGGRPAPANLFDGLVDGGIKTVAALCTEDIWPKKL